MVALSSAPFKAFMSGKASPKHLPQGTLYTGIVDLLGRISFRGVGFHLGHHLELHQLHPGRLTAGT